MMHREDKGAKYERDCMMRVTTSRSASHKRDQDLGRIPTAIGKAMRWVMVLVWVTGAAALLSKQKKAVVGFGRS
jgi:hypothetical protein